MAPTHGKSVGAVERQKKIEALAEAILQHKRVYYAGQPSISDVAYDRLEGELAELAPDHPALRYVGTEVEDEGAKVIHDSPMLSLQKTYDLAELERWADGKAVVGTLKVDGVSLSLVYESGALVLAKTRGNGSVGEDVTGKIRWVSSALSQLLFQETLPQRLEIRGEIYCTETNFLKLARCMEERGLERPTSPRNIVAGLLGRKTHIDLSRFFSFFAFEVVEGDQLLGLRTETERFAWLEAAGFDLPKPRRIEGIHAPLVQYLDDVRTWIEEGEVPIDGAVFSYDDLAKHRELGATSHHPRYKMSFKWQGETAESVIVEVAWATSRLGVVTPVAVIEPVVLSGAKITNVTLHNAAHVKEYNLKVGDRIEIVRSGEVIPKFLQVVRPKPEPGATYAWPAVCPACGTALVCDDVRLRCPNRGPCPAQRVGAVLNWIRSAEIDDLSEKRLEPLMEAGLVRTAADLYRLQVDDFYKIPQTKEKMANKLYRNIQARRTLPLARFLNGLGIEGMGLTSWEKLLDVFPSLDAVQAATSAEVAAVDGFAAKTAADVVTGLQNGKDLIQDLLAVGVTPEAPRVNKHDGVLLGKILVITGALSKPRAAVEKAIKEAGGRVASSVSAQTAAVITDDPHGDSTKLKKARALGVPLWSEGDLWQALGEA